MATRKITELPGLVYLGLVALFNDMAEAGRASGLFAHEDVPADALLVDAPDASSLATSITLANDLKAKYNAHAASTGAHKVADAVNVVAAATAVDLATTNTLLNELKADFNAHIASTTYHHVNGGAGGIAAPAAVATADAIDQATANALANALKAAVNRHMQSGAPTIELTAS